MVVIAAAAAMVMVMVGENEPLDLFLAGPIAAFVHPVDLARGQVAVAAPTIVVDALPSTDRSPCR